MTSHTHVSTGCTRIALIGDRKNGQYVPPTRLEQQIRGESNDLNGGRDSNGLGKKLYTILAACMGEYKAVPEISQSGTKTGKQVRLECRFHCSNATIQSSNKRSTGLY
jgi:hypothetical protein